jgi:hypothetical protein
MKSTRRIARIGAAAVMLATTAACGNVGNVLGSVLGGGPQQSGQVSGSIQGVNQNTQQITIQQSNGQSIAVSFDNQTRVVYQNQNYPPTALEYGDRVTANVQALQNGSYYTDYIQVDQSVSGSGGATGNAQSIQGNVRQVDSRNGLFTVDAGNYGLLTVSLPYNPRSSDVNRFQNLRSGDFVRFYGVFLNNQRVELRQFY